MSTNNSNNSNGTIYINGTGGGGGGGASSGSGNYIPAQTTWTFTISPGGFIGYTPEPAKAEKKKDNRDGCDCKKCKEFYPYSEPNQEDGTLICYACRHGY